jgi:hypothetical protein
MAIGKQGSIVKPTPFKAQSGPKHGGGQGPSGGKVAQGKTPSAVGGNKKNIK